ncbi:MAG: hypothetical protein ACK56I_33310 [bacterium]
MADLIEADHAVLGLERLHPRLPGVEVGIGAVDEDDRGCIFRPLVAQVDSDAVPDGHELRGRAAIFGAHFGRVRVGRAEDQESNHQQRDQRQQSAQGPLDHLPISAIQRRTTATPCWSTLALPSSGMAMPGSALFMR